MRKCFLAWHVFKAQKLRKNDLKRLTKYFYATGEKHNNKNKCTVMHHYLDFKINANLLIHSTKNLLTAPQKK